MLKKDLDFLLPKWWEGGVWLFDRRVRVTRNTLGWVCFWVALVVGYACGVSLDFVASHP